MIRHVLSLFVGLATLLDPQAPTRLSLQMSARKTVLLVGEPTSVEVEWTAGGPIDVSSDYLELWLNDGTGYQRWLEAGSDGSMSAPGYAHLDSGLTFRTSHIVGVTGPEHNERYRFAWPVAGQYRLMARYRVNGVVASSNSVAVNVVRPGGRDAEVFDRHVSARPEVMSVDSYRLA